MQCAPGMRRCWARAGRRSLGPPGPELSARLDAELRGRGAGRSCSGRSPPRAPTEGQRLRQPPSPLPQSLPIPAPPRHCPATTRPLDLLPRHLWASVQVSRGCCDKWPYIWWLRTTQIILPSSVDQRPTSLSLQDVLGKAAEPDLGPLEGPAPSQDLVPFPPVLRAPPALPSKGTPSTGPGCASHSPPLPTLPQSQKRPSKGRACLGQRVTATGPDPQGGQLQPLLDTEQVETLALPGGLTEVRFQATLASACLHPRGSSVPQLSPRESTLPVL